MNELTRNDLHKNDPSESPLLINKDQIPEEEFLSYQNNLRRLASEISLIEARERREIASDLHDHIGQALAYVSQRMSILQGNVIFSGMEDEFAEILSILKQTIQYTRNLTIEISPPVLYELGLPATIDWLAERTTKRHKIKVQTSHNGIPVIMAEDVRVFMFKTIQEIITNVVKHADAKNISIICEWQKSNCKIIIEDDGCGFDYNAYKINRNEECCFGLFNIRERLSFLGGTMDIESIISQGTKVILTAPYLMGNNQND
jgi:signal transduction histidine kinase